MKTTMGRPKTKKPKIHKHTFRLDAEAEALLSRAMRAVGIERVSDFIRGAVLRYAKRVDK